MARDSRRGSACGIAPCSIPRVRKVAQANSRSRICERASWRASSSRARRAVQAGERLLGDQHAVAQDLVIGQLERGVEHGLQRLREVLVLGDDALELLAVGLDGQRLDLVQAVQLGLEVVVERRRADADRLGDVRPLAVLVALLAEVLDRGREDVVALASRRAGRHVRSDGGCEAASGGQGDLVS